MPKASEVAAELRKLAESLEREPEAEIAKASVYFRDHFERAKENFLNLVRLMPRPFTKEWRDRTVEIEHDGPVLRVWSQVERSKVCHIVKPAQEAIYECEPLLSEAEEAQIGGAA